MSKCICIMKIQLFNYQNMQFTNYKYGLHHSEKDNRDEGRFSKSILIKQATCKVEIIFQTPYTKFESQLT
jgi:hypothetical protein